MCNNTDPVFLANDTVLTSESNGAARMYWGPSSTWTALRGMTVVDVEWLKTFNTTGAADAKLLAQTSIDGASWGPISSDLLEGALYSSAVGTPGSRRLWIAGDFSDSMFVRLGIQVSDANSTNEEEMRLTLSVTPRVAAATMPIVEGYVVSVIGSDTAIGSVYCARDVDEITMFVDASELEASETVIVGLRTAPTSTSAEWVDITGSKLTLTGGGVIKNTVGIDKSNLSSYVEAYVDSAGTSATGYLNVFATIRPLK